jgi:hypothetical protein
MIILKWVFKIGWEGMDWNRPNVDQTSVELLWIRQWTSCFMKGGQFPFIFRLFQMMSVAWLYSYSFYEGGRSPKGLLSWNLSENLWKTAKASVIIGGPISWLSHLFLESQWKLCLLYLFNSLRTEVEVKVKFRLRSTISRPVCLGVKPHLEPIIRFLLLSDSCGFVGGGWNLWREDMSVV